MTPTPSMTPSLIPSATATWLPDFTPTATYDPAIYSSKCIAINGWQASNTAQAGVPNGWGWRTGFYAGETLTITVTGTSPTFELQMPYQTPIATLTIPGTMTYTFTEATTQSLYFINVGPGTMTVSVTCSR